MAKLTSNFHSICEALLSLHSTLKLNSLFVFCATFSSPDKDEGDDSQAQSNDGQAEANDRDNREGKSIACIKDISLAFHILRRIRVEL